ncbi:DnaA regulatory inactivator Hda [Cognatilysobacter lacus]|uniref:DnaA regulatory inactivator Hda n=1 Tax=Cognatilysobacter lacus TaxID=1643323 RepID=A0A5D8Z9W0_9GAMM|nr:DnaA regulatory inactivator Hda [Lysobacter lacus]TZF91591.1 DnaA regulatory inactivator Hda [Lysobacter lacus]
MSGGRHVPQLPLALRYPPDQRLETFVGAPEGAIALLASSATVAASDWLYVSGLAGSGKTHLLLGACTQALEAGRRPAYLSVMGLAGRVADAVQALEGMDLVAIDDLDAIAGNRADEVALFDFHNRARAGGANVIYAGTARPDALELALPDLRSRLGQCVGLALQPLDDDSRREVLRQRAQRRGLAIDEAALDWLLRRVGRDLGSLAQLFDRLDREALAAQRRLSVPFLRDVLGHGAERPD